MVSLTLNHRLIAATLRVGCWGLPPLYSWITERDALLLARSGTTSRKSRTRGHPRAVIPPQIPQEDEVVAAAEEQTCKELSAKIGFSPDVFPALREFRRIHGGGIY